MTVFRRQARFGQDSVRRNDLGKQELGKRERIVSSVGRGGRLDSHRASGGEGALLREGQNERAGEACWTLGWVEERGQHKSRSRK